MAWPESTQVLYLTVKANVARHLYEARRFFNELALTEDQSGAVRLEDRNGPDSLRLGRIDDSQEDMLSIATLT